jgi:alanine racemase
MAAHLIAELSAAAIESNIGKIRGLIAPGCGLWAVVKADAYGLGLETLLPVMKPLVDGLAVSTPQEALQLRGLDFEGPVLVLFSVGVISPEEQREVLAELIRHKVTLTVCSAPEIDAVAAVAGRLGLRPEIHLKVDSGMGRSGILDEAAPELILRCREDQRVLLSGVFTHFATADEADKGFAEEQLERFLAAVAKGGGRKGLLLHAANSAATIGLPRTHLDAVRTGIAVYGYRPSSHLPSCPELKPALRLRTRLMQVKTVPAGSGTGYGLEHTFERESRVGLVPIGYGDGYLRSLGGRATLRIRDRAVPVCGRVAMDQIVVDLTELEEVSVGQEIEVLAADADAANSVEALAALAGTIPYEILCRLGQRIERRLVPTHQAQPRPGSSGNGDVETERPRAPGR